MISKLTDAYWGRVFAATAVPSESLGTFRWFVGLFLLLLYTPHYAWIGDVPAGMFHPPVLSVAYLVGGFPPAAFFVALDVVAIVAIVAMTIGWHTRLATLTVVATQIVGTNFTYSFGKIDHTHTMLIWLLAALAFSAWGDHFTWTSVRRPAPLTVEPPEPTERTTSVPLAVFATVLAFGMFTAGLPKLRAWVDFNLSTSGLLNWFYPNRITLGRDGMLSDVVPGLPAAVLELSDYAAVLMELLGIVFLLAGRRTWLVYLTVATAFHIATALVLDIPFAGQVVTYVAFAGLTLPRSTDERRFVLVGSIIAVAAAAWHLGLRFVGRGSMTIFAGDRPTQIDQVLYVSLAISVAVLIALMSALSTVGRRGTSPFRDRIQPL